ncbi:DUF4870 domain-containing protein [Cytobacillus spongiae]|uniref:DUF4870 domain-containing protein n=1 Tax=Cytobacillus spongiae TaxID=2901381 RepID=UPI001F3FD355|nr:DUF4870 domain-containing protein [Cytobacillus spongiae]UII55578.1 DUF4870 domain-containing protein [Cytobacillus spongiae]
METKKVLSALSYLSVLFAGIIVPIILYFVAEDTDVKKHAKKALLSHLILLIPPPVILITIFSYGEGLELSFPILLIVEFVLFILLSLAVVIWNIVRGIQLLTRGY